MSTKNAYSPRFVVSIALFAAALIASFLMSAVANHKQGYWVALNPIPAGSVIQTHDLSRIEATLGDSRNKYLETSFNPVGAVSKKRFLPGEFILIDSLSKRGDAEINEEISLSLRSVDIPSQVAPGSLVNIYQLQDAKNGEVTIDPLQILQSAQVTSLDRKGSNFGGEVALTISANPPDVKKVLAASTSGRLVAVHSHE